MASIDVSSHLVRHFRQILLWPLQLMPLPDSADKLRHWQVLTGAICAAAWHRVEDEFTTDAREFQERHYKEFVAFLPYVQRFLYGESRSHRARRGDRPPGESALKVFRRDDITALRIVLRRGDAPIVLAVAHIDLYFFDDIDVVFLNVEVSADDLPLATVRDLLYRFGRAYPTGWDEDGGGVHNVYCAEWLADDGRVLASSDSNSRAKFLYFACHHRSPGTSAHWAFLLEPLALDAAEDDGIIRYRQIEYHRMPLMAYLAVENPRSIPQEEWLRLGLIASLHPDESIPMHDPDVVDFAAHYAFDRYWTGTDAGPNTRFLCSGRALIVVGDARAAYFVNHDRGILGQFRHQYFILFLIAHFHQAALLVFSERLVDAIHDLDISEPASVRNFRRLIHLHFESFLRFTHRYWFQVLSEHPHMQALHRLCNKHLGNAELYDEVKEELRDMSQYLDSDAQRRQSKTVVRLTVVTTFSLVGTVTTGFLGMNLIDETAAPLLVRCAYFFLTFAAISALTAVTVLKSRQLSDVMDVLSDDRLPLRQRLAQAARLSAGRNT